MSRTAKPADVGGGSYLHWSTRMADKKRGAKKAAKDLPTQISAASSKQVKGGMMRSNPLLKKEP